MKIETKIIFDFSIVEEKIKNLTNDLILSFGGGPHFSEVISDGFFSVIIHDFLNFIIFNSVTTFRADGTRVVVQTLDVEYSFKRILAAIRAKQCNKFIHSKSLNCRGD